MYLQIALLFIFSKYYLNLVNATDSFGNIYALHKPSYLDIKNTHVADLSRFILNIYGIDFCNIKESSSVTFKSAFKYPELVAILNINDYIPIDITNQFKIVLEITNSEKNLQSDSFQIYDDIKEELNRLSSLYATKDHKPLLYLDKLENNSLNQFDSLLSAINDKLSQNPSDQIKDLIYIHGPFSINNQELEFISKLEQLLEMVYNQDFVLLLIVSNMTFGSADNLVTLSRKIRAVGDNFEAKGTGLGRIWASIVRPTPAKYSSIFNIIFWLSLLLALTVYVIVVSLWNVDPGRDSIIYRITNPRYNKKDL